MRRPPSLLAVASLLVVLLLFPVASAFVATRRGQPVGTRERLFVQGAARSHAPGRGTMPAMDDRSFLREVRGGGRGAAGAPAAPPTPASSSSNSNSNSTNSRLGRARVLGYFGLWYALNVFHSMKSKHVLKALNLPFSVGVLQLGIGSLWVGTQWLLRIRTPPAKLDSAGAARLARVAFFHGAVQLEKVVSLGGGLTHVVKAMEPFLSAVVAAVWFRQVFPWQVYASLVPVVAGVALTVARVINFSWVSFLAAMASNLLFACRSNFSKALMTRPPFRGGVSTSSANLCGLVTVMSFAVLAPWAALTEGRKWAPSWERALKNGYNGRTLALNLVLSGIYHYLNNEVLYVALGSVHPTTLSVGTTMERVVLIVGSFLAFDTPVSPLEMVGTAVSVGGVLVYSLANQHYGLADSSTAKQQQ